MTRKEKKILIVEDEADMIQFYVAILSDVFTISIVSSGEEALKQIRHTKDVDLVLLDYKLSDMSGLEVLKEAKKVAPSVPVIMVTAFGDEDLAVKLFRNGARDYIKKPFSSADLLKRIEFYISFKSTGASPRRIAPFDDHDLMAEFCHAATSPSNIYKIQKAIKYIDDNYMSKIRLDVVARKSCMSKYHCSRIFKEVTTMTYQNYLNTRRVEKAKELLKKNLLSITAVAFSVGYEDLTHFERIFRKITGLTPSRYKNLQLTSTRAKSAE